MRTSNHILGRNEALGEALGIVLVCLTHHTCLGFIRVLDKRLHFICLPEETRVPVDP